MVLVMVNLAVLLTDPDIVCVFVIVDVLDTVSVFLCVIEFSIDIEIVGVALVVLVDVNERVPVTVLVDVFVLITEFVFEILPVDVFDFILLSVLDGDIVLDKL